MTIELMGPRRHEQLIKAASETIDGINAGAVPNAALFKAAKEHDLNSKEVAQVSQTVNNALTVSHLADSEPEQKADPFVITNADEVSQQLFPDLDLDDKATHNDPEPGKKPEGEDVESPLSLDPQDQAKKTAAEHLRRPKVASEDCYQDDGRYFDLDALAKSADEDVALAREAFGVDDRAMAGGRRKVAADLNGVSMTADWGQGDRTTEHAKRAMEGGVAVDASRVVGNPYTQLRNLKVAADEARTRYDQARTAAFVQLEKVATDFRRTDAPQFARISALAKRAGVSPGTLGVIFTSGGLDRFGHRDEQVKLASHGTVTCTHQEMGFVENVSRLETMWKQAAHCLAAQNEVERRIAEFEPMIHKIANLDSGAYAKNIGDTAQELPGLMMGGDPNEVIGAGISTDDDISFEDSPLDAPAQQRLRNTSEAATFTSLMDDDYIAQRPIPEIVKAYNAAMATTPGELQPEMLKRLVKEQLATGEDIDVDTMVNLNKTQPA